jgi:hypothetical protein
MDTREDSKAQAAEVGQIPIDDKRTLVLTVADRSPSSFAETIERGYKWERYFRELEMR